MTLRIKHIKRLFLYVLVAAAFTACLDMEGKRDVCDYKVQLRYDYNEENTSQERNMIEYYVYTIDEYIFDEAGILYDCRTITPDRCREMMNSQWNLPPGRYSVIAIGNRDERSVVFDGAAVRSGGRTGVSKPTVGITRRDDMLMSLDNCETRPGGMKGPCEQLFHGYKTFTVKPQGISRIRIDMTNAHLEISFRITWNNNATPARGSYYAVLENVPSEYNLMPQYIYPAGSLDCQSYDGGRYDLYPDNCNNVIHHIPYTCHGADDSLPGNVLNHRTETHINADSEMWGKFVSYRIKNATKTILRVYSAYDDSNILPQDYIDIQAYLDWHNDYPGSPCNRDHTLKQEYALDIVIDGPTIIVNQLDTDDWDEGGIIK